MHISIGSATFFNPFRQIHISCFNPLYLAIAPHSCLCIYKARWKHLSAFASRWRFGAKAKPAFSSNSPSRWTKLATNPSSIFVERAGSPILVMRDDSSATKKARRGMALGHAAVCIRCKIAFPLPSLFKYILLSSNPIPAINGAPYQVFRTFWCLASIPS